MSFRKLARRRRIAFTLAAALLACPYETCFSTDLAKRFREVYGPAATAGIASAVANPDNPEAGIRDAFVALINGLGALVSVKDASTSSTGS